MTLERLGVRNLRNLEEIDIQFGPQVNLIYGENGSGKSSILEAIHILASGRSFRTRKHKTLIRLGQTAFTLFGKYQLNNISVPMGVTRTLDGDARFKLGGQAVASAAELASCMPMQFINSDTFALLDGSPKVRREFIDWLVFHVEPCFYPTWKDAQRCLQQRNSLLKANADYSHFEVWDRELSRLNACIHEYRSKTIDTFRNVLTDLCQTHLGLKDINIAYFQGWAGNKTFSEALALSFESDLRMGYTQIGMQKADLVIKVGNQLASDVLSRGQQKLLVCTLKIAQGLVFSDFANRKPIYLIDDLPAELDTAHRTLLISWLKEMGAQVVVTGIEQEQLIKGWEKHPYKLFHVEQGRVIEQFK